MIGKQFFDISRESTIRNSLMQLRYDRRIVIVRYSASWCLIFKISYILLYTEEYNQDYFIDLYVQFKICIVCKYNDTCFNYLFSHVRYRNSWILEEFRNFTIWRNYV